MSTPDTDRITTVNYHLWEPCNMRCRFCFATFQDVKQEMMLPKGHLPEQDATEIVNQLAEAKLFRKINFAGGEPTLCSWLPPLIKRAKEHGMQTSIVTNGSKITDEWLGSLNSSLDIIALSIDSVNTETLTRTGRTLRGKPITEEEYLHVVGAIKRHGIRLKINTVVTSKNWREDFTGCIRSARPERWKLLQVLPIEGQNDEHFADFQITASQFDQYVQRNRLVEIDGIVFVPETKNLMTESYVMVDPAGRFYDNANGAYSYSDPILKVGVEEALRQISTNFQKFKDRGGQYE